MIRCTYCKKELREVEAYGSCMQKALLNRGGEVIDWGPVEEIYETVSFTCPHCHEEITDIIKT